MNTYTTLDQYFPSVAGLSDGKFVVTWASIFQDGSDHGIYGQMYNTDGSKYSSEFRVNTYTASTQQYPSAAGLINGKFVVTWQSAAQDGDGYGVYSQMYNTDGSKYGLEFQVNTYTMGWQLYPSVASLSDGRFVVTWISNEQDGDSYGIYGQMYNADGSQYSSEFQVNTYTTLDQVSPSIAGLSNGKFVVTWSSDGQDGKFESIYGQMFNADGSKYFSEFQVNTYTMLNQDCPSIAGLSDGKFVVTWSSSVLDDGQDIHGQMYNTDGSQYSSEFQVNTYTTLDQDHPSIAGLSDGKFVVTWSSSGQDGDGYGVFGQIFSVNETSTSSYLSSSQQIPESSSTVNSSAVTSIESSSTTVPSSSIESLTSPSDQSVSTTEVSSTSFSNTKNKSSSKLPSSSSDIASQTISSEGINSSSISSVESQSSLKQSSSLQSSVSTSNFFSSKKSSLPSATESSSSLEQSESTNTQEASSSTSITEEESSNSAPITSEQSQKLSSSEAGGTSSMVIILAAIIGGVCAVLCIAGSGVGYWLYRRKRDDEADDEVYQLTELKVAKKKSPSHKGVKTVGIDPQKLSKFEKIGRGAMGVVYKAKYHGGDKPRDVAIKQMPIDLDDYDALRQLANEATLMEELKHPNIVQLLGYYQKQMNYNIVMEYVSGGDLCTVLYDTEKAFPWNPTRWDIAHDIASAVYYLHTNDTIQIIHRDLKSLNVLIYYQGARMRAKVADVGIAKVISEKEMATMTKGMGTPLWMAPEVVKAQGEGKKITYNEKVDVYSYGIILSELINRKAPYSEIENLFKVVPFVLEGGRPEIKEKAPASFVALMKQCWAQPASDRPEMEKVVDTLDQIEQEVKSFEC